MRLLVQKRRCHSHFPVLIFLSFFPPIAFLASAFRAGANPRQQLVCNRVYLSLSLSLFLPFFFSFFHSFVLAAMAMHVPKVGLQTMMKDGAKVR